MKGLTTDIQLTPKGGFKLMEGSLKGEDAIHFYCKYDRVRTYYSDFGANFKAYLQKPASFLVVNAGLILNSLQNGMKKYVSSAVVDDIDVGYMKSNRKEYTICVKYHTITENSFKEEGVTFV